MMQWRNVSPYHLNSIKNCQSGARLFNFKTITPFANFTHVFVFCLVCMQHPSFNNFSELATLLWFTKIFTYPKLRPTARNWCCLSFPFWSRKLSGSHEFSSISIQWQQLCTFNLCSHWLILSFALQVLGY